MEIILQYRHYTTVCTQYYSIHTILQYIQIILQYKHNATVYTLVQYIEIMILSISKKTCIYSLSVGILEQDALTIAAP